jgi:hypothetical protein
VAHVWAGRHHGSRGTPSFGHGITSNQRLGRIVFRRPPLAWSRSLTVAAQLLDPSPTSREAIDDVARVQSTPALSRWRVPQSSERPDRQDRRQLPERGMESKADVLRAHHLNLIPP